MKFIKKIFKKINFKLVFAIATPILIWILFEAKYMRANKSTLLPVLLVTSLYLIFVSLFKNTKWAALTFAILFYFIFVISRFKLKFTLEPFYFSDVLYIFSAGEIVSLVDNTLGATLLKLLPLLLGVLVASILIVIFNFKFNYKITSTKKRLAFFFTGAFILIIMFFPSKSLNHFMTKYLYHINDRRDYHAITSGERYCNKYGHLSGIYGNYLEGKVYEPDNYDTKEIKKVLTKATNEEDTTLGKPNIIVVFSESFWDVDQLSEVEFDKPVTENFNKLKNEGLFFNMISPSFGGISANVEFEFLTGGSLNYFGTSFVPYMNLYRNNEYYNTPSIIKELRTAGYYTKIVPYSSNLLFNCGNAYNHMRIDEKEYMTNIKPEQQKGGRASDESVTDKIIDEFKNKKKDQKLFYMTLTMQGHMPYDISKYGSYDIQITKSNLDTAKNEQLLSYSQGVYDADKQLGRLYEFIKEYEEPTIIVFYGDHLPYLDAYDTLEYFNTNDKKLDTFRKYNTQSLVLANFDISNLKEENNTNLKYLGVDLLSSYILNHMDIEVSDYYKWLYSTRNTIGASNKYVSVDPNGNIYYTNNLSKDMKKVNTLREKIQYNLFIK